jgi:nicotinamide riboside kinase
MFSTSKTSIYKPFATSEGASTVNMETLFSFSELRNDKFYLVKSDGDRLEEGQTLVYHVDTESRSLYAVSNIGSHAFFVHHVWCISVDTRVHPIVQPGCIYYTDLGYIREYFNDMNT